MKETLENAFLPILPIASISPSFIKLAFQLCASTVIYVRLHLKATPHCHPSINVKKAVVLTFIVFSAPPRLYLQRHTSPFGKVSRSFARKGHRSLCCLSCMEG